MNNPKSDRLDNRELEQLKAVLEGIYREGPPINEMGDRIDLNGQVLPLLGLDKILKWAESLLPDMVVGQTVQADDCPVHRYLKDCGLSPTLITCGSIRGKGFVFTSSKLSDQMPIGVSKLISLVDNQGKAGTPITAQTLVALIQQVEDEYEHVR